MARLKIADVEFAMIVGDVVKAYLHEQGAEGGPKPKPQALLRE